MLWLAIVVVLIGVVVYSADKKIKAKFEDKFNPTDWDLPASIELAPDAAPQSVAPTVAIVEKIRYERKSSSLPQEQAKIFKALQRALAGEYTLLTNINAADILSVAANSNALIVQVAVKNIATKQFDFVVCDNEYLGSVCVIMVGDNLDPLLVNACESAQLPLACFRVQANYDSAVIRASILQAMGVADIKETITNQSALNIVDADTGEVDVMRGDCIQEQPKQEEHRKEDALGNGIVVKVCPNCSAVMLKRKAKNGVNAGKLLWICSTYPKCRGVLLVK